jgi:hypothetical protein
LQAKKAPKFGAFCLREKSSLRSFPGEGRLNANDFAGLESAGADVNALRLAVNQNANLLHVNAPSATVFVVGVGNVVSGATGFAGNETSAGHDSTSSKHRCKPVTGRTVFFFQQRHT